MKCMQTVFDIKCDYAVRVQSVWKHRKGLPFGCSKKQLHPFFVYYYCLVSYHEMRYVTELDRLVK